MAANFARCWLPFGHTGPHHWRPIKGVAGSCPARLVPLDSTLSPAARELLARLAARYDAALADTREVLKADPTRDPAEALAGYPQRAADAEADREGGE